MATLDTARLRQLVLDTDRKTACDLVARYIVEATDRARMLRRAAAGRDLATMEQQAHALISCSLTFGADTVHAAASAIEQACQAARPQVAAAAAGRMTELVAQTADELQTWLDSAGDTR